MKVMDHGKEVTWAPHNADGRITNAYITLKQAFAMSVNTIAVKLGQECGIDRIAQTAHDMGIKSELKATPALALGASDVNLLELVNAYCTPMNNGGQIGPVLVAKIEDRDGRVIYEAPTKAREVLSPRSAFLVQQLLKGGMHGTSSRLMGFVGYDKTDVDFGGKTGTSNNHSDAWFIGTTPRLVVGAWVGGEYRSIHFRTGMLGQGNRTALPICGYFLRSVLDDPAFKQYRTKCPTPADLNLNASDFDCGGYYQAPADSDSISTDSLDLDAVEQEIPVDAEGNGVAEPAVEATTSETKTPAPATPATPAGEATERKE
jgi:penicillin-binding protein 1A